MGMMMLSRISFVCAAVLALVAAACDTVPLTAPTGSSVTIAVGSSFVPTGGTTEVTAFVAEESGTAVQNGTTVRFTTNLGRMEPFEVQTKNGYAVAMFVAGDASGVADVRATSGGIGTGTSTGTGTGGNGNGTTTTTAASSNVIQITVGVAAAETVLLIANPTGVAAGGGTVELLATVVSASGRPLQGVTVTFVPSAGQLASPTAVTDANGQARTTLTTNRETTVKAVAGVKESNEVTVRAAAAVTASVAGVGATPVPMVGQQFTFTATVNAPSGDPTAQPVSFEWDFGDGTVTTTNGNVTAHIYTAESSGQRRVVTVRIRLANGQTLVATTEILVGTI
jgi:adhesin/invasin